MSKTLKALLAILSLLIFALAITIGLHKPYRDYYFSLMTGKHYHSCGPLEEDHEHE